MAREEHFARSLTAQLIAHARSDGSLPAGGDVDAVAAAFHQLSDELCRWMGTEGCQALLARALQQTAGRRPALEGAQLVTGSAPRLERLNELVAAHGAEEMRAALEDAIEALLQLLGRLIGEDLSVKLVERTLDPGSSGCPNSEDERL